MSTSSSTSASTDSGLVLSPGVLYLCTGFCAAGVMLSLRILGSSTTLLYRLRPPGLLSSLAFLLACTTSIVRGLVRNELHSRYPQLVGSTSQFRIESPAIQEALQESARVGLPCRVARLSRHEQHAAQLRAVRRTEQLDLPDAALLDSCSNLQESQQIALDTWSRVRMAQREQIQNMRDSGYGDRPRTLKIIMYVCLPWSCPSALTRVD